MSNRDDFLAGVKTTLYEAELALHNWSTNQAIRRAERELATQAGASYKRLVTDQRAGAPARKVGASATPERA